MDDATLRYGDAPWENIEDSDDVLGVYLRLEDDLDNLGDYLELFADGTFLLFEIETDSESEGRWGSVGANEIRLFR